MNKFLEILKCEYILLFLAILNMIGVLVLYLNLPNYILNSITLDNIVKSLAPKYTIWIMPCLTMVISIILFVFSLFKKDYKCKILINFVFSYCVGLLIFITWVYGIIALSKVGVGDYVKFPFDCLVFLPIGTLVFILANVITMIPYKSKIGFRTKFSCSSEDNWIKFHNFVNTIWSLVAFLIALVALIGNFVWQFWLSLIVTCVLLVVAFVVPMIYSCASLKNSEKTNS